MSLIGQISHDITEAMRSRDQAKLGPLRMLKAAFMNREVQKGAALDDAEALQVVGQLVKQRRDSIEQFRAGGRPELADKEQAEIAILERYQPAAASPAAIDEAVSAAVTETGATSPKDMGKVIKAVMAKLTGMTVDGRTVSEAVKARLSK